MKKTQVALAALALVASTAALASDVTVYGTVDVSIVNSTSGTGMGGLGNNQGSIFGFKGSEDLGGGLTAGFNLEGGYTAANGAAGGNGGDPNGLFNRAANVSLGTADVGITLGTQITPFITGILTGANGAGGNGVFVPGLIRATGGGSGIGAITNAGTGTNGFFIPNAVSVRASGGGIGFNALTTAGEKASGTNSKYSAGSLTGALGPVNLALAYQTQQTDSTDTVSNTAIGANTSLGELGVHLMYSDNSNKGATGNSTGYQLGVSYPLTASLKAGLAHADNKNYGQGSQTSLSLDYSLSKRTLAYATYSRFENSSTGGLMGNDNGSQTGKYALILGVAHSF